jgi:hypothetical protein
MNLEYWSVRERCDEARLGSIGCTRVYFMHPTCSVRRHVLLYQVPDTRIKHPAHVGYTLLQ